MTNPPWGFGIQLQSEFKALLLNLEHNTQQPWVLVLHPEQGVTAEHCRAPPKNTDGDITSAPCTLAYKGNYMTISRRGGVSNRLGRKQEAMLSMLYDG